MSTTRVRTTSVREFIGARVRLHGWLHARRKIGKIQFLVLRDGHGTVQVVAPAGGVGDEVGLESVLEVEGTVVANAQARAGVELVEPAIRVLVPIHAPLPLSRGQGIATAGLARLLDHGPVTLREASRRAPLRIAAVSAAAFRTALGALGFTEVFSPRVVGAATEGGSNVFTLDYFGSPAYLAQSPQLYKQMMVGVFERVFEVGPVFRAEPHATVRHLSEYTSLDVEMGFIEGPEDVSAVAVQVLREMVEAVAERCGAEVQTLGATVPRVPERVPSLPFAEARRLLAAAGEGPPTADDLAPAEERWLGAWAAREHESALLVVHGYPTRKRPFYTQPSQGDAEVSASFDLLFRGTELITGGQRIHEAATLRRAMAARGLNPEAFGGYLEAFDYGLPPHGGFAIGLERWVAGLCGLDNIRLARAFPRDVGRTAP